MLLAPSVAVAQDRAIPEPDSPAGVEYQLPLDRAREEASDPRDRDAPGGGGSERDRGGSGPAPLFGTGISPGAGGVAGDRDSSNADSPSGGGASNPDARRGAGGDRADRGSGGSSGSSGEASEADGEPSLGPTSASAASGSSDLALPGIALGVLLIGGLLGLALRRGMGPGREA